MIYETFPDSNSNSKDESESEDTIDHFTECNGSGTVGALCQEFEDTGMIYEASNSKAKFEEADQTIRCPDCNRSGIVRDICDMCNSTYVNFLAGR